MYGLNEFADEASSQYVLVGTEKAQAHSKAEGLDEQKRASEKAETANAGKQVCLSVWELVVHRQTQQ